MQKINPVCSSLEIEKLTSWLDDVEEDLIVEAINEALLSNVRNYKYVASILNRCVEKGIKTKEQFDAEKNIRKGGVKDDRNISKQNETNTKFNELVGSKITRL